MSYKINDWVKLKKNHRVTLTPNNRAEKVSPHFYNVVAVLDLSEHDIDKGNPRTVNGPSATFDRTVERYAKPRHAAQVVAKNGNTYKVEVYVPVRV